MSNIVSDLDHLLPKKEPEFQDSVSEDKTEDIIAPAEQKMMTEDEVTKGVDTGISQESVPMEMTASGGPVKFEVGDEDETLSTDRGLVRELSKIDEEEEQVHKGEEETSERHDSKSTLEDGRNDNEEEGEDGVGWSESGWDDFPEEEATGTREEGTNNDIPVPGNDKGKKGD